MVCCVGLVVFRNFGSGGVVTIDAFLGVASTLIGVGVTLMVGLQILNYIGHKEIIDKVKLIDRLKEQALADKKQALTDREYSNQMHNTLSMYMGNTFSIFSANETDIDLKIFFNINSIVINSFDKSNETKPSKSQSSVLLVRYRNLKEDVFKLKELGVLGNHVEQFHELIINKKLPDYNEIYRLHHEIVLKLMELQEKEKSEKEESH